MPGNLLHIGQMAAKMKAHTRLQLWIAKRPNIHHNDIILLKERLISSQLAQRQEQWVECSSCSLQGCRLRSWDIRPCRWFALRISRLDRPSEHTVIGISRQVAQRSSERSLTPAAGQNAQSSNELSRVSAAMQGAHSSNERALTFTRQETQGHNEF
eukprot:1825007-Amphidinium_carterae.2